MYNGYLLKIGNYTVPNGFIKAESYKTSRKIMDLDSYRDANGVLHRNALEHVPMKVEFSTIEDLTHIDIEQLFSGIRTNYISVTERKVSVCAYVTELNDYVTQDMYIADPEVSINYIKKETIYYKPIQFSLTGY